MNKDKKNNKWLSTDTGTFLLHWITVIAMFVSLFTGLRIAADSNSSFIAEALTPILPQGEIWTVHFYAGLVLFFSISAYIVYMMRSGLSRRISLSKVKMFSMPVKANLKWDAANALLHWAAYVALIVMTVTGVLLFIGYGGLVVRIHTVAAIFMLAYVFAHIIGHFGYGGLKQVLRVFYPKKLVANSSSKSLPLLIAFVVGFPVMLAAAGLDFASRDKLSIAKIDAAPTLDGQLDDAAWKDAKSVKIKTNQGENSFGHYESTVEVKAVHDGQKIYFAFKWEDSTNSARRNPLIKKEDGWHVIADRPFKADVTDFYEDKFAVLFSKNSGFGGGEGTHMGERPLKDLPAALNKRGLHYTIDGSYMDLWQWKSARGGLEGFVDDQHIGPALDASDEHKAYKARYQGGYTSDPGSAIYEYNYKGQANTENVGPVEIKALPVDLADLQKKMGTVNLSKNVVDDGAQWWMHKDEYVAYSEELDAQIPVGTVIPGVLFSKEYEGDRADLRGGAKWENGYWTLETSRDLKTGSQYDHDFVAGETTYMFVSVFDHTQTRHSRHARAVSLTLEE